MMISYAKVKIWGVRVGLIVWNKDGNYAAFEYDKDFWRQGLKLSPIELPLSENAKENIFSFRNSFVDRSSTFKGLPGLLADSLPDRFGSKIINEWLKSEGRKANSLNPVEKLCFIGKRGMGSLEFEPEKPAPTNKSSKIEISGLVKIARDILSEKETFMESLDKKSWLDIFQVGTSAGGARPKAIIAFNPKTKEVRSGQVDAPAGFSHWIIKFDGVKKDDNDKIIKGHERIEFAYYLMSKDCGIDMTECRLYEEKDLAHFMTRRFDRDGNRKIHVQTLSALRHFDYDGTNSYEDLFDTMMMLELPNAQFEQMFRRMVFNVLAVNSDDHTKNFSFMMDRDRAWKISPAYDVTFILSEDPWGNPSRASSINGKTRNITRFDFWDIARKYGVKKPDDIIKEVSAVLKNWKRYADKAKVKPEMRDMIDKMIIRM